jgi:hypothetical protein
MTMVGQSGGWDWGDRPIYYLFAFDQHTLKVHLAHNEDRHPADFITHDELAPHVKDPVHGFAYAIAEGWRITEFGKDAREYPVEDQFILHRVVVALGELHP